MQLKTAGDLRGFLADVLVGVRNGSIDANKANAISKVAAQINQSLATEVSTRLRMKELGADDTSAGAMLIGSEKPLELEPLPQPPVADRPSPSVASAKVVVDRDKVWCEQCDMQVTTSQAISCKSKYCTAKAAA